MASGNSSNVLAIGIDAAEASFVKKLIELGDMPALKSLLADDKTGKWLSVQSPAHIGSGTVWPTFMTGEDPSAHGVYSEWSWRPETMSLSRYHGRHLTPFWKPLAQQGVTIGVLDVPFALPVGVSRGFEVCEWWAHDSTGAGLQAGPPEVLSVVKQSPPHPLSANRFVDTTPDSQSDLKELTAACVAGVKLRGALAARLIKETKPQLSLLVFPEIHHASHQMWHTVEPEHQVYKEREFNGGRSEPLLKHVYRAVDQQLAGLIEAVGSQATVMVFALHGFRPALGFPAFPGALLIERGFSRLASWSSQSWSKRALTLLASTKRHTPEAIKRLYYKSMPTAATHKLAQPTMLPAYDWENTRAFSLPTDQYGWIRVNLIGREALGSVPLDQYDKVCKELETMLLALVNEAEQPLVQDITRTAGSATSALGNPLPDLVVHWRDAAFASPVKIKDSKVRVEAVGKKSTGQHASEGFCIYRAAGAQDLAGVVVAKDLGRLITASL
ncbi:MAG TPA: alkaline phosphatase family protein [Pyrinomonadaceae bacterium]|jgi:predicted AlkP superfamily phosphohydrolase/phosphomutase|nr:alkaline phosphatase family protein [Pyrinomonadaceae bacterium]